MEHAQSGGTVDVGGGTFTNEGVLQARSSNGLLSVDGSIVSDGQSALVSQAGAQFAVSGNLLGDTQSPGLFMPLGTLTFDGAGTAAAPQLLEVMSQDVGPKSPLASKTISPTERSLWGQRAPMSAWWTARPNSACRRPPTPFTIDAAGRALRQHAQPERAARLRPSDLHCRHRARRHDRGTLKRLGGPIDLNTNAQGFARHGQPRLDDWTFF